MLSRIHLPRLTGDVRVGLEVIVNTPACVSTPPRGCDAAEVVAVDTGNSVMAAPASR